MDVWETEESVTCVVCPHCAFTFDAYHTDTVGGGYSCPACEVVNLERWKAEALAVLTEWDACYDILEAVGHGAPIGRSKARHVADYLKQVIDQRIDDQLDVLRRRGWKFVECREYGTFGREGYVAIFWSMYGWRQPQFTAPTLTGAIAAAFADLNDKDGFD